MLRVGIIGCGKIADGHVEQIRAIGRGEVVAVCDREPLTPGRWTKVTLAVGGKERMIMQNVEPDKARAIHDMASVKKIFCGEIQCKTKSCLNRKFSDFVCNAFKKCVIKMAFFCDF